jgi:hypothetical protein
MANVFCFLDNSKSSINDIMAVMNRHLGDASHDLV